MNDSELEFIRHFPRPEIEATGSDVRHVKVITLMRLDFVRDQLGLKIKITCLTTGIHEPKSFHYTGDAVDWKFLEPKEKWPPQNKVIQTCLDAGFKGIGVYDWGYHCDNRHDYALWKRIVELYLPLVEVKF
jgi:hypothetical protein